MLHCTLNLSVACKFQRTGALMFSSLGLPVPSMDRWTIWSHRVLSHEGSREVGRFLHWMPRSWHSDPEASGSLKMSLSWWADHLWSVIGASGVVLVVKVPPADAGDLRDMRSLGQEEPLEEGMAIYSSNILAWEIPWTESQTWLKWLSIHKEEE